MRKFALKLNVLREIAWNNCLEWSLDIVTYTALEYMAGVSKQQKNDFRFAQLLTSIIWC